MTRIKTLFEEDAIAERVELLAKDIVAKLGKDFTVIGILKGSFVFMADLVRALDRSGAAPRIELMRLSSYGRSMQSSGEVKLIGNTPDDFEGKPVLLVDDIVDTGLSLSYGRDLLKGRNAREVWTCALLDKPSRRKVDIKADFVGFDIPDVFVVGYGIDYAERFRHLPFIGLVDETP